MPAPPEAVDGLKLWQRFHIRLSVLYGGLVLAVLLSVTGFFYTRGVASERAALAARLRIGAMSLAAAITPEDIAGLRTAADVATPAYQRLDARFRQVATAEPDFSDLYIMRRGPTPGSLEMVVDAVILADAPPGKPGEPYEADRETKMLQGFDGPVVEDDIYTDAWGTVLSGYAPIRDASGTAIAIVGIDVRAARIAAIKREVALLALGVLAVALVAMVILALVVARSIRKPLAQIVAATNAIAKGELHVRADLTRNDEFGVVGRHFDDMANGLEERDFIKNTFGQYVAPEVVQQMIAGRSEALSGQRRHAAVMFVDVRGFTTLSETLAPEDVVTLLNDYLDRMTEVITRHGGRIDKFIGDAIMAIYDEVRGAPPPAVRAVRAALAMQAAMPAFNQGRSINLAMRIGINTGPVVRGDLGSRVVRRDYTVIGDTVNQANRYEAKCPPNEVLVSASTRAVLGDRAKVRELAGLQLKGVAVPVTGYVVESLAEEAE